MPAIDVATLKLRCDPRQRQSAQRAIEDALHTEIADDQRLRLVRRLSIGAQGSAAHPAWRQAAVRDAWRAATADARHASADDAGSANCVWFADRAEAEALLLARLLAGKPAAEWFWRLALPGWRGAPVRQFLSERLDHARAAQDDAAILALTEACIAAGATALLVELLAAASAPRQTTEGPRFAAALSAHAGLAAAEASETPTSRGHPLLRIELTLPPALAAVIRQVGRIGVAAGPVLRALLRAEALRQSPALGLNLGLLEAVVTDTLDLVVTGPHAAARTRPELSVGEAHVAESGEVMRRADAMIGAAHRDVPEQKQVPFEAVSPPPAQPQSLAEVRSIVSIAAPIAAQHSRHAGLWLIIPSLEYLGLRGWLAARPELLEDHPARQLLMAIARHHRVAIDDPALTVLTRSAPEALPEWTQLWRRGLDRWLRRTTRRRLHDLVNRPGVISVSDRALDVRFPPAAADIRLRRLALDRDPGWVDWLGLSVRYQFRNAEAGMNGPHPLHPPATVIGDALARLAAVAEEAGHPGWMPPALAIDADRLAIVTRAAGLDHGEALAVALLLAAECDAAVARMVAAVQAPVGGARPLAGLIATLFGTERLSVPALWSGGATRSGLIVWGDEVAPLPERSLSIPPWLAAALAGFGALPPGVTDAAPANVLIPARIERMVATEGALLAPTGAAAAQPLLVIRCHCPAEGDALAQIVADTAGLAACQIVDGGTAGLALWLTMIKRLPVVHRRAAPGETIDLSIFDSLATPLVLIAGRDGQVQSARKQREWRAPMPDDDERAELWRGWGLDAASAEVAAARYRQGAGRIAEIGRRLPEGEAGIDALVAAMREGGGRIDALARRCTADVRREDIVLPGGLGDSLDRLRDRILLRNRLHDGLGPTIAARYRPGVRALFTGESGTGKTLATHWLAQEAGLPCYRVDLAALTSKWIGETEKNLSQLLDAAEQGDVVLFFDEADALFGARTDVSDANDRHANAQTNFLLQRIEEFEGVALLATNSRDRFDPAFVRRLDMVLEFPLPDAAARRQLWDRHLGSGHAISAARLDQVAATIDLAGGHVRNIVLAAAARAKADGRQIAAADIDAATAEEYAKLGRTPPPLAAG